MITSLEEALSIVDKLGIKKSEEVLKWEQCCISENAPPEHFRAIKLFAEALTMRRGPINNE
jgi:hypothetical protein